MKAIGIEVICQDSVGTRDLTEHILDTFNDDGSIKSVKVTYVRESRSQLLDCGWGADHDLHPHPGMPGLTCPGRSVRKHDGRG